MNTRSDAVDLQSLLDSIQEFIVVKDGEGRWLFCNETALKAYGIDGFDYIGVTDEELIAIRPVYADGFRYNIETDTLAWQNGYATMVEKSFMGLDGRINTWEVIKTPSFDSEGKRHRLVIVSRNITERKLAEEALKVSENRLRHLAFVDALTGIPNRRGIMDMISQRLAALNASAHRDAGAALLYLDLDNFKRINDQLGHAVGDELLVAFARRTRHALRDADLFGRIGGDEFIIFLACARRDQATDIAQRLCEALQHPWAIKGLQIKTSSSIGVAFYPEAGQDVHTLKRRADEALYQAKAAGRAQVNVYMPEGLAALR
ncbi:GGDEF domain-containing protein [Pseudomonas ovata]|uniref:GGDEF domain-containing protein n=1 Tax=Pseudomonas ovata TaxID=1839709 RepID=UPI000D697560|nr:GGDEF domain-containing protein [Pseudomonas ovata]